MRPDPDQPDVPPVAAICIYPDLVAAAVERLRGSGVKGSRPWPPRSCRGGRPSAVKLADVAVAVDAGADEIDMVIDRGAFLSGRYGQVYEEIVAVKEACGRVHLKVILETGELGGYDYVRRASWLALLAGADVIKTSTGKISPAATLPVVQVMLLAVRDWHRTTGEYRGVKARGRHPHGQGRDPPPRRRQRGRRPRSGSRRSSAARSVVPARDLLRQRRAQTKGH